MAGGLRRLAMTLSQLPKHPQNSVELEQYCTEGDFAARWISAIVEAGDLNPESKILDLGAGNGILGIGLLLAGGAHATLIEIDSDASSKASEGLTKLNLNERAELLVQDLTKWKQWPEDLECDLLIMNPPWGFQKAKADRPFLQLAFSSPAKSIHLLHSANATHPPALGKELGWHGEVLLEGAFRLPANYEHHKQGMAETAVKCWRFVR